MLLGLIKINVHGGANERDSLCCLFLIYLFIYLFLISEKPKQNFFPNLMWKWDYYEDNAQVDSLYLV